MANNQLTLPSEIVKKSNQLIRAKWSPNSILEPRLVALVASMVHTDDKEFKEYRFPASTLFGDKDFSGKKYNDLKKAIKKIMKSYFMLEDGDDYMAYSIFSKCGYEKGEVVAAFHPDLKPHFVGLKKNFTQYNLMEFLLLPSTYSQRIFEFLKSWDDKPEITVSVNDLHEMLGTPKSFQAKYSNLKNKVLEKAHSDILKFSNFSYEWEPIKKGRKIESIRFILSKPRKVEAVKKKQTETQTKQSQRNTEMFKKAVECFKSGKCEFKENSKLCQFCQKQGISKEPMKVKGK